MCTSCIQQVSSCFPELWQPLASCGSTEDTNGSCPAEASHRVQQIACKNVSVSGSLDCLGQRGLGAGTACLLSPCISPMVSRGKDTYLLRCNPGCSTSCAPWGLCEAGMKGTLGSQGDGKQSGGGMVANATSPFCSMATAQPICRGTTLGARRGLACWFRCLCGKKHVEKLKQ